MLGRLLLAACALAFAYGTAATAQQRPQPQPQQQTEPRIAFVVGNAGYQRGPIPQALNDAGLVAEALRSIGFEIVEGADLRQPDILRNFRDFLDKVQAAGPDAIAFVYFSGYGLSFEGDNYLVGSDARLDREGDIAIEAVRLSDLMRSLGESQARAKVMIIDAARPSPFTPQGRGLAKGLAAVEPPQGMLIAFSNAPGAIAPDGQGAAYGPYATAIAEMLRAPGLDMDGIFTRIRARTHETTQGAITPWYMSSLGEQIELVPPEAGVQAAPAAPLMRAPQPMRGISPEEAYALAIEMDTLNGYVEFVETYPRHPLTRRVYAIIRARREALAWMRARQIDTPPAYWTYLSRYPNGIYAFDAERRLRRLSAAFQPPPGFGAMEIDVPPPIEGEPVEYVDAYEFREPPPRIMMAPPPRYIIDLPPPRRRTISPGVAAAAIALPLLAAPLIAPLLAPAPRRGPPPSNANFTPGAAGGVGARPSGGGTGQRWGNRGGAAPNQAAPTQTAPTQTTPTQVAPSQVTPNVVTPGVVSPAPGTTPGAVRQPPAAVLAPGTQPGTQPGTWPPGPRPAPGAIQPAPAPGTTPPPGVATRPPPGSLGVPPPGPRPQQQPPAGAPAPSANVAPTTTPSTTQPGAQPGTQQRPGFQRPPGAPPPGVAVRPPPGLPPPGVAPRPPGSPPPAANTNINRPPPPTVRPNAAPPPAYRPPPAVANRPPPLAAPPAVRQAPPPPPAARQAPPPQVVNRPPPAAAPPPPRPAAPPPPPPPRVAAPPPPRPPAPPPAAAKPPQCPPGKTFTNGACK